MGSLSNELKHHGVKGMKWGIRKERELVGDNGKDDFESDKRPMNLSEDEKKVLKKVGLSEKDSTRLQDKYGPGTLSKKPKPRLTDKQKKILIGVGVGVVATVGVAAAIFFTKRHMDEKASQAIWEQGAALRDRIAEQKEASHAARMATDFANPQNWTEQFQEFMGDYQGSAMDRIAGLDPNKLGTESFSFKAGDLLKRISTESETSIRPDGFYAAFKEQDVNRYKAVLPLFWRHWGKNTDEGFVVNLKAAKDFVVPSEKQVFDIFRDTMDDMVEFDNPFMPSGPKTRVTFSSLLKAAGFGTADMGVLLNGSADDVKDNIAKNSWFNFVANWVSADTPYNKHFFDKLKGMGFDALIDSNDVGGLAETPLRVLNGSIFSIAGADALPATAIKAAQEAILALKHAMAFFLGGESKDMTLENALAHHGVKGMKWGVRRSDDQLRRARGDISEDYLLSRKHKKTPVRALSNSQLKALNERLQLERNNNDLQSRSALAKIKKGTAIAAAVLAVGTTVTTAYNFSQSPAGKAVISIVTGGKKKNPDWLF